MTLHQKFPSDTSGLVDSSPIKNFVVDQFDPDWPEKGLPASLILIHDALAVQTPFFPLSLLWVVNIAFSHWSSIPWINAEIPGILRSLAGPVNGEWQECIHYVFAVHLKGHKTFLTWLFLQPSQQQWITEVFLVPEMLYCKRKTKKKGFFQNEGMLNAWLMNAGNLRINLFSFFFLFLTLSPSVLLKFGEHAPKLNKIGKKILDRKKFINCICANIYFKAKLWKFSSSNIFWHMQRPLKK